MNKIGVPISTAEGWAGILAILVAVAQTNGWIPADLKPETAAAATSLVSIMAVFALRKLFRKGSTPFVVDGQTIHVGKPAAMLLGALVALLAALGFARVANATPTPLSIDRLSTGVAAQAAIYSGPAHTDAVAAFAPKAWVSYSVMDELSIHASYQLGVGKVQVNELHGGVSARVLKQDPVRVALAVDAVGLHGRDAGRFPSHSTVEYSLRFSRVLARADGAARLALEFQPGWVPENTNFTYRVGLTAPLWGGRVIP